MGLNMYIKYMLLFFREIDELNFQFSWNQCVNMKGIYSEKKRNFHSPKKKKNNSWNQRFSKTVAFTNFLSKNYNCELDFPEFLHYLIVK